MERGHLKKGEYYKTEEELKELAALKARFLLKYQELKCVQILAIRAVGITSGVLEWWREGDAEFAEAYNDILEERVAEVEERLVVLMELTDCKDDSRLLRIGMDACLNWLKANSFKYKYKAAMEVKETKSLVQIGEARIIILDEGSRRQVAEIAKQAARQMLGSGNVGGPGPEDK